MVAVQIALPLAIGVFIFTLNPCQYEILFALLILVILMGIREKSQGSFDLYLTECKSSMLDISLGAT